MFLIRRKCVFVIFSALLPISLAVPLNSKNIERKQRDIQAFPVKIKPMNIFGDSESIVYELEPYNVFKHIMYTQNLQRNVPYERNSYRNKDLKEENGQAFNGNIVSEQSNINPVIPVILNPIDFTENLTKENDLSEQIMQINKTIDTLRKDYNQIRNTYDKLKEFQESYLNSNLQNDMKTLSISFENQTRKVNDALSSLQFQIDIIKEALLELIVAIPIYSDLYSYQDPAFFSNKINYPINKNDTLILNSGRTRKKKYQNNLEKPKSIFKFYVLIDKLENDFNDFNKIINVNKSTASFDLKILNKTIQSIILDSKDLKNQFLTLPMDHNANITKQLYNSIDKFENDIENIRKFNNLTTKILEVQKLFSDLKTIQQNYLYVYSINLDLSTKNYEISKSIYKILSILHSIVENTDDFNENINHMDTIKLKNDQQF